MTAKLRTILNNPYSTNTGAVFRLTQAFLFGLFVFLFLAVFKPFGMNRLDEHFYLAALGFGAVTFVSMVLLNLVVPLLFSGFFKEARWTVGKEIFYTMVNLWFIGLLNLLFFNFYYGYGISPGGFLWFQFSTIAIGIFPIVLFILYRERSSRQQYVREASALTSFLTAHHDHQDYGEMVTIRSRDGKDDLVIGLESLYYIQSADNYVEVFHFSQEAIRKTLVRNTLKSITEDLSSFRQILRCHKSYLVNLDHVKRISGNAQGYKLHLEGCAEPVPVSRTLNAFVRERITVNP